VDERERFMRRALELAQRGSGRVSPNPMVGAVVVRDGEIVGEGWHAGPGTPHAEAMGLAEAGDRARGATVYCTLEPCDHSGRTPPCTLALIDAGVERVIAAIQDPNPIVDGSGFTHLREAGIGVDVGLLQGEARRLNAGFERHVTTGRPYVTLKMATSLDGKVAARDRSSKWISGPASREDAHRLRAANDAILVGAGTVIADDPSLTVRGEADTGRAPLRVVVDAAGRIPVTSAVFDDKAPTLVVTTSAAESSVVATWRSAAAEVVCFDADEAGSVALAEVLDDLGKRDVQGLLVEGGPTVAWNFVRDGLIDRVVFYIAPKLVGGAFAPSALMGEGFAPIASALDLRFERVDRVGDDLRLEADVHGDR
jgi:diaminohydroxyphosphoribosylaminopyrimidine deaminase / 5-amino-6-(5-phosphoribosylamino)uracil reductase